MPPGGDLEGKLACPRPPPSLPLIPVLPLVGQARAGSAQFLDTWERGGHESHPG